jgi:hypothetical protein
MAVSYEMQTLLDTEVLPMYEVLDSLKNKSSAPAGLKGCSVRNLIGQAQLREVSSPALSELIAMNNVKAMQASKTQYVFLLDGKDAAKWPQYQAKATVLEGNAALSEIQALNLNLNLQLIEMESIRNEKEGTTDDDDTPVDDIFN